MFQMESDADDDFYDEDTTDNTSYTGYSTSYSSEPERDMTSANTEKNISFEETSEKKTMSSTGTQPRKFNRRPISPSINHSDARVIVNVIKPKEVNDWRFIVEDLTKGSIVIINYEGCPSNIPQRVTDSVAGAAYALSAVFRYINQNILIVVPEGVELTGHVQKSLTEKLSSISDDTDTIAYDYDNLDDTF